jgi:hypothetical protein
MTTTASRADACTTTKARRKPAQRRTPALLYPDLPSAAAPYAIFWRAAFLRDLAQLHAAQALLDKTPMNQRIVWGFLHEAMCDKSDKVRIAFSYWIDACGGLAGHPVDSAATGSL